MAFRNCQNHHNSSSSSVLLYIHRDCTDLQGCRAQNIHLFFFFLHSFFFFFFSVALCPQRLDTFRDIEPRMWTSFFTQLLLQCCFMSTETRHFQGHRVQNMHPFFSHSFFFFFSVALCPLRLDTFRDTESRTCTPFFHTASSSSSVLLYFHWDSTLSGTQSPEHAPLFFTQLLLLLQCCFMSTETRHFQGHRVQNMHPFFSHSFFFFFSVASCPQRRYRLSGT